MHNIPKAYEKPIKGEITLEVVALRTFQECFPDMKTPPAWKDFVEGAVGKGKIKDFINGATCERIGKSRLINNSINWNKWLAANRAKNNDEGKEEILYAIIVMKALDSNEEPEKVVQELTDSALVKTSPAKIADAVTLFYNDEKKKAAFEECLKAANITRVSEVHAEEDLSIESVALKKIPELLPESKKAWSDWNAFEGGSIGKVAIKEFVKGEQCDREARSLVNDYQLWADWANANRSKMNAEGNAAILYSIIAMEALDLGEAPEKVVKEIASLELISADSNGVADMIASIYKNDEKRAAFEKCLASHYESLLRRD